MNLTEYASQDGLGLAAVAGPAVGGPFEIPRPATPYLAEIARPAGSRRIAVTTKAWSGLRVDPAVAAAVAAIANLLEQMGHTVIEDTPAFDYGAFLSAQIDLWVGHTDGLRDGVDKGGGVADPEIDLGAEAGAVVEGRRILDDGVAHLLQEIGNGRDGGGDRGIDPETRPGLRRDGNAPAAGGPRDFRQIGSRGPWDLEGTADGRARDGGEAEAVMGGVFREVHGVPATSACIRLSPPVYRKCNGILPQPRRECTPWAAAATSI